MQLFQYIRYKWKKKFNKMNNQQNDALLAKYKQQYFGQTYQWMRPINNETVGDLVRVVDVKMRGDMVMLVFNSGSPLNVDLINTYLKPMGKFDPMAEPMTGGAKDAPAAGQPIEIPAELREFTSDKQPQSKIAFSSSTEQRHQQAMPAPEKKKSELFALFQSEEKSINLPLRIKMPDIALVKMMYNNAADKDKFLGELAEYIIESISVDTAKNAMAALLDEGYPAIAEPKVEKQEKKQKDNDNTESTANNPE